MKVIESLKVKEKVYIEKLENGLTVMIIPKKDVKQKYIIWGTKYGSNDSKFVVPGENEPIEVPQGVAHFLEHKMFEQENGTNSLDTLTSLGVNANAYTTNDHTAYLFKGIDNFYEALDELMDYVQHPYFTDENVEKEKGIIGQEIMMYDDSPQWKLYMNTLTAMYHNHPIKIDTAGSIETISHIDKDVLYKCYNTFYNPSNMIFVACGDFVPEEFLEEVKKRLIDTKGNGEIKRIYPEEPEEIVKKREEKQMQVSVPFYCIGLKLKPATNNEEMVKRQIANQIILDILCGKSSKLYNKLYDAGTLFAPPDLEDEEHKDYAFIMMSGVTPDPDKVYKEITSEIETLKAEGIEKSDFERIKKNTYGEYVREYEDVETMGRNFLADAIKGINNFDYLEAIESINLEYTEQILKDLFNEEKMVLSIIR